MASLDSPQGARSAPAAAWGGKTARPEVNDTARPRSTAHSFGGLDLCYAGRLTLWPRSCHARKGKPCRREALPVPTDHLELPTA
jgi:hypothetical protein